MKKLLLSDFEQPLDAVSVHQIDLLLLMQCLSITSISSQKQILRRSA